MRPPLHERQAATRPGASTPPPPHSDYIVFVDESGDHSLESVNRGYPIFVLAFCILPTAARRAPFVMAPLAEYAQPAAE